MHILLLVILGLFMLGGFPFGMWLANRVNLD